MSKAIDHLGQKKIYLGLGVLLVGYLGYRLVQWILNSADSSTKKATTIGKKKLPTENQQPGDPSSLPVSSATTTATKTTTVFAPATSPVKVEPHEQAKPSKILANYILSFNSSHPLYNYKDNYLPIKNKCIEASIPNLIFDDEKSLIYVCGSARAIPQLKIEEGLSSSELYASFFGIRSLCHLTLKKRLLYLPPKHVEFLQKAIPRNEQELRNIISQIPLNVFSVKHATVVDRKYIHWINQLRLHFHTYYDMETLKRLLKESGWEENNLIGMGYTIEAPYKLKYYSDYTLCEYTPASDLFTNLLSHQEQSEFDSRSCGFDTKQDEKDEVAKLRDSIPNVLAHGIERGKGGLLNMLNFILEGHFNGVQCGSMGSSNMDHAGMLSGSHGPFFIVPTAELTPAGYIFKPKAYLVPSARDKELLFLALDHAETGGFISQLENQAAKKIIYTHREIYSSPEPTLIFQTKTQ